MPRVLYLRVAAAAGDELGLELARGPAILAVRAAGGAGEFDQELAEQLARRGLRMFVLELEHVRPERRRGRRRRSVDMRRALPLLRRGTSIKQTARELGVPETTLRRALERRAA